MRSTDTDGNPLPPIDVKRHKRDIADSIRALAGDEADANKAAIIFDIAEKCSPSPRKKVRGRPGPSSETRGLKDQLFQRIHDCWQADFADLNASDFARQFRSIFIRYSTNRWRHDWDDTWISPDPMTRACFDILRNRLCPRGIPAVPTIRDRILQLRKIAESGR